MQKDIRQEFLSVIIPAHNEAGRIVKTLDTVRGYLIFTFRRAEIIVVENGSTDNTAALVEQYISECCGHPCVSLIRLEEGDKGQAVRAGMLAAIGTVRYMADADLATPINEVTTFIDAMVRNDADVVIGNRNDVVNQTAARALMSAGFKTAAGLVLGNPDIKDTQAGFKLFSEDAALLIFSDLMVCGWAFDVEALLLAQQRSLKVVEIPIPWEKQPDSKIRIMDPLKMLLDLGRIKRAHAIIS